MYYQEVHIHFNYILIFTFSFGQHTCGNSQIRTNNYIVLVDWNLDLWYLTKEWVWIMNGFYEVKDYFGVDNRSQIKSNEHKLNEETTKEASLNQVN